MYVFRPDGKTIDSVPLGIGNEGWNTPQGRTKTVRKKKIRLVRPQIRPRRSAGIAGDCTSGPDNPLGSRAVYLGWPAYLFHGTNKPFGVGRGVSHGCVRLYPEDIERRHDSIKIGTPVTVIDQAMKITRIDELSRFANQKQSDEVEQTGISPAKPPEFEFRLLTPQETPRIALTGIWPNRWLGGEAPRFRYYPKNNGGPGASGTPLKDAALISAGFGRWRPVAGGFCFGGGAVHASAAARGGGSGLSIGRGLQRRGLGVCGSRIALSSIALSFWLAVSHPAASKSGATTVNLRYFIFSSNGAGVVLNFNSQTGAVSLTLKSPLMLDFVSGNTLTRCNHLSRNASK